MDFVPNDRQRQAIEHVRGPMLVVAGAGTGKTTVLAHRVARLIAEGHARPGEVLAVTYTEAAAEHLKRKVSETLRDAGIRTDASQLQACTFHAYCLGLLKKAGRAFGIVDDIDLWVLLRRRIRELPLKHYRPARDPGEFLHALREFFSHCHDELVDARRYKQYVADLREGKHPLPRVAPTKKDDQLSRDDKLERCAEIAAVFSKVEQMLSDGNLGTFGHMITGAVRLLREDPAALREAQQSARFLLIDEFQDANVAQIELARLLAGDERNVFAVGDPDQAIYHFRGASGAAFEEFLRRFPGTKGVVLDENQRSTSNILACAYAIIRKNPQVDRSLAPGVDFSRRPLVSAREARSILQPTPPAKPRGRRRASSSTLPLFADDDGGPAAPIISQLVSIVLGGKEEEATDVADQIRTLVDRGNPGSIAVLCRTHTHPAQLAYELAVRDVPAVVQGIDMLETPEGRDFMAALGAVASLSNTDALFRLSAFPVFALDPAEVNKHMKAAGRDASYATLLPRIPGGAPVMEKVEAARAYAASVDWQAVLVSKYVAREFGFDATTGATRRICDFIVEWRKKAITESGELKEFVEYAEYFQQAGGKLELTPGTGDVAVQLMTAHAAKGLEFDRVFVLRANSGSFPVHYREPIFEFPPALREMQLEEDVKELHKQEERRLFYVALTRARDYLSVCAKPSKSKKKPTPAPPGLLGDLMNDPETQGKWTSRSARPTTVERIAAAAAPQSGVASWMAAPLALAEPVLSATSIDAFNTCPLKYKLLRMWRNLPGPVSAQLTYGSVLHEVLRDLHQAEGAGRPRAEAQVLQLFQQRMDESRFDDALQAGLYRELGARQLSEYCRLRAAGPRLPVLEAENVFKVKIAGVLVRGRMDRVDEVAGGGRRVIDFKTGSAWDQKKADDSLQFDIYALAARALWGAAPAELVIYNLEDQSEVVSTRTRTELSAAEDAVRQVAAEITEATRTGDFPAHPEYHCRSCDFRSVCPATEQRLYTIARAAKN